MTRRDDYLAAWPTAPTPADVWRALIVAAATDDTSALDHCTWRAEMASIGPKWSDPTTDRRPVANITHRAEQGPRRAPTTHDPRTDALTEVAATIRDNDTRIYWETRARNLTLTAWENSRDIRDGYTYHRATATLPHLDNSLTHLQRENRQLRDSLYRVHHSGSTAALMGADTTPQCARLVDPLTATGDHTAAVVPCWAVDSTGSASRSYVADRPDTDAAFFRARGWQGADLVGERGNCARHGVRDRARDARLLAAAIKLVRTWQRGGPVPRVQGTGVLPSAPRVARETITLLLDRGGRDSDPAEAGRLAQRVLAGMRA